MSKLLQIAQLGDKVLRAKAAPVKNIDDANIQNLINDLIAIIKEVDGVGMSATQIYQTKRIFILASNPNARYPNAPKMEPTAIINPKIITHSQNTNKDWEGCLSIPGIRALIPRYNSITVEYADRHGKDRKEEFKGFIARIFQHEYDHLEGLVFLDRVVDMKEIITDSEYLKIINKSN